MGAQAPPIPSPLGGIAWVAWVPLLRERSRAYPRNSPGSSTAGAHLSLPLLLTA